MPKVSILIPTYNVEQYLRQCLDSVVNQTLKDIEIICINDGSTDNSLNIIKEYAQNDSRIKIIDKKNSGYGDSMNKGLDAATGKYIGIVEPDDYVPLDMYETLYNTAEEQNVDLIKADFNRFIGEGETLELFYNKLDRTDSYYNKVINPQEDLTPFTFIMNTWSGIYKRDFIEKFHIRHNTTPGASFQDNGFWFQTFALAERIYFLDKPFYMNRRDNPNSSVKDKGKVYLMKYEYDFIRKFLEQDTNRFTKFIGIYNYRKFHNYLFNYKRIDIKFKKEFLKVFREEFKKAVKNNEIDYSWFHEGELKTLKLILKNPNKFYRKSNNLLSLTEKIFSIKNIGIRKVITILGVKIKLKSKKLIKRQEEKKRNDKLNKALKSLQLQNEKIEMQSEKIKNLQNEISESKNRISKQQKLINEWNMQQNMLITQCNEFKAQQKMIQAKLLQIKEWQLDFYKLTPQKFPKSLSDSEVKLLCRKYNSSKNYLEFGSGGSTFLALMNSNTNIYSVESDPNWLDYLRSYNIIRTAEANNKLHFQHIDIGQTKEWGYPVNDDKKCNYPEYSNTIFEKIKDIDIDLVFIDGRFRVACTIAAILNCKPDTYFMIHDYTLREYYHVIEEFLDIVEQQDTLVVFKAKPNIQPNRLHEVYEKYKYIKE